MKVLVVESPDSAGQKAFEAIFSPKDIELSSSPSLPPHFTDFDVVVFNGVAVDNLLGGGLDTALSSFVRSGRGCVGVHDSIGPLSSHVTLLEMMGLQLAWDGLSRQQQADNQVVFSLHLALGHPSNALMRFPVRPARARPPHPIISAAKPFDIGDEFWAMNLAADVIPLLYAEVGDRFSVVPRLKQATCVAGCRNLDKGRCVFFTLGHYSPTFQHPTVRGVLQRAVLWAGKKINTSRYAYDIFISYSSANQVEADQFDAQAKKKGLRCFLASRELSGGDRWDERIRKALISSRELCVLISKASLKSEWVTTECGAAWALNKWLTPILLDVVAEKLPDRLKQRQAIKLSDLPKYLRAARKRADQDMN
jgi:type 1 glutamine amidotransferase